VLAYFFAKYNLKSSPSGLLFIWQQHETFHRDLLNTPIGFMLNLSQVRWRNPAIFGSRKSHTPTICVQIGLGL
jgi:hypothetical protein